jgi:hypothetical protein
MAVRASHQTNPQLENLLNKVGMSRSILEGKETLIWFITFALLIAPKISQGGILFLE